ncbi:GL23923 [Drosophila persimilis]|uniref:GL23923 n=1 Tax=Drosophila persimilis TaxID=7234 RepID=B4G2K4_DROPE|nr:kelch-like protein 25 [Drosophila persimilis]EDW24049.1 GL23923 [Drosophila persimilis]
MNQENEAINASAKASEWMAALDTQMEPIDASNEDEETTPIPACSLREMGYREPRGGFDKKLCSKTDYKEYIIHHMNTVISNQQKPDIVVYIRGQKFNCHLAVLKTCTKLAKDVRFPNGLIIAHKDVTAKGFELAYDWMIHQDSTLKRKDIVELYMAAEYMQMPELLTHLWSLFHEETLVTDGMAFQIYLECLSYGRSKLQSLMLNRVRRFFLSAVTTEEYLRLEFEAVCEILGHYNICVNSEMEIYYSAVRWLHHDWPKRKEYAPGIMEVVQFQLMPTQYITSIKEELQELHNIPAVQTIINGALSSENMQQKSNRRHWVYDKKIPHHHNSACPRWRCLDLTAFNTYLEQIIAAGPNYSQCLLDREEPRREYGRECEYECEYLMSPNNDVC